jgi:pantoate--beta-alanine ligase
MPDIVTTVADLRDALASARSGQRSIGLVPTMGALHAGHLSLVGRAAAECDLVVVSIFVNPLQFGAGEDFDSYPRDLAGDVRLLRKAGVTLVFAPETAQFTRAGASTTVCVAGLTSRFEGAARPGHFDGVATIVTKLFNTVGPDRAYFGEKDYQQLAVIRRMVTDLDQPVRVVGCPIVRDDDGLALSSRNAYLSAEERARALALPNALALARTAWDGDAGSVRRLLRTTLGDAPGVRLDYAEVVDPETLEPLEGVVVGPAQVLVAATIGRTRLLDNVRLEPRQGA